MKNENAIAKTNENEAVKASQEEAASAANEVNTSDEVITGADVMKSSENSIEEITEIEEESEEAEEMEEEPVYLTLERESFKARDKRKYWGYYVSGKVYPGTRFEKTVKASFVPADKGGYELLEMMFEMSDKVLLDYSVQTMKNENTGLRTRFDVFMAFVTDPYGNKIEYKMNAYEKSDTAIFKMLYQEEKNKIKETE